MLRQRGALVALCVASGPALAAGEAREIAAAAPVAAAASALGTVPASVAAQPLPLPYQVSINGMNVGDAVLLKLPDGRLLARVADLQRWKLRTLAKPAFFYAGDAYQSLDAIAGYRVELDSQNQRASLSFQPQAFTTSVIASNPVFAIPPQKPQTLGSFLNYEVVASRQDGNGSAGGTAVNGDIEAGVFNDWGVLTSQWLGRNLTDEGTDFSGFAGNGGRQVVRLNTTFTRDMPATLTQLTIGDAVGGSSLYGRPVRFGGVRYSRNFSTQPGYAILPQPALSGETTLPSVLELYVDGVRRQTQDIPPGPFQVNSLPVFTGGGEVEVVVRDLLGREQIIRESYFTGAQQLRAGLDEFSYETGFVRNRFALRSEDYGQFVAVGTHRYGFSDEFTGEARAELLGSGLQTLGFGSVLTVLPIGVISTAVALSHSDPGYGGLGLIGIERSLHRGFSIAARAQFTTNDFRQVGFSGSSEAPQRVLTANMGYAWRNVANLGVSYFNIANRRPSVTTSGVTSSFSTRYGIGSMSFTAIERIEPRQDLSLLLNLAFSLPANHSAGLGYAYNRNERGDYAGQEYARVQRNLPTGEGWGYRAEVRGNQGDKFNGNVTASGAVGLNGPYGSYGLEAVHSGDITAYRGTVSGSLGAFAEHVFVSRRLTSSFALVETGVPDLPLSVYGQLAGRTDRYGVAILPELQPYQANNVRIDTKNLPLDISVAVTEVDTAPYFRSGVLLSLPAKRTVGAVVAFTQANGRPVPAGATLQLLGDNTEFPVGKKGEAYITGLKVGENVATINWAEMMCTISFTLPADAGFQPSIGPFQCMENPQ